MTDSSQLESFLESMKLSKSGLCPNPSHDPCPAPPMDAAGGSSEAEEWKETLMLGGLFGAW